MDTVSESMASLFKLLTNLAAWQKWNWSPPDRTVTIIAEIGSQPPLPASADGLTFSCARNFETFSLVIIR